tara:strand:- start:3531 stop:3962 length:432 start_codon:yes stop_codon:yes gene_type:complete
MANDDKQIIDLEKEKKAAKDAIVCDREGNPLSINKGHRLQFGEKFKKWNAAEQIEYLIKLASSMNHAADMIQRERDNLMQKHEQLFRTLESCEKNLDTQKQININIITSANAKEQKYIKDIQLLQSRVKAQDAVIEKFNAENE